MEQTNAGRHAYLIAAHNKPAQLITLLTLLNDACNDIYLHLDAKATCFSEDALRAAAPKSRMFFVERRDARWGSEVFIDVIVSLLARAASEEHVFYHMLSGVDLPLKPQREIHAYFDAHAGEEFVSFERETAKPEVIAGRIGLWHWTRPVNPFVLKFHRRLTPLSGRLQQLFGVNRVKKSGVTFQKGGVWFSITHAFARYALEQMPKYRVFYKHSSCADEIWLQTALYNSPFMQKRAFMGFDDELAATMRYVDWTGGGASPRTLTSADFDMLMESGLLFARKFDEAVDADVIRRIAAHVSGES